VHFEAYFEAWLSPGATRDILPKWSKNDHFFEIKKEVIKHYFSPPKAIFSSILDINLRRVGKVRNFPRVKNMIF
jgi:hypothetical protein